MKLPSVKDLPITAGKSVLLRTNYDVPLKSQKSKVKSQKLEVADDSRIRESLPTINFLLEQKAKVIILSHLGRPGGKVVSELSLKPVVEKLREIINSKFKIQNSKLQFKIQNFEAFFLGENLTLLENLRFNPGEEGNDLNFAKKLAQLGDFYVNDAFACSHREHTSIVGIPQFLPSAFGLDFLKEIEILSKLKEKPQRPITVILGGAKEDKLEVLEKLLNWADYLLIGGKLPQFIKQTYRNKVLIAQLNKEGKDITLESVRQFKEIIDFSETIIWAGPLGFYEDKKWEFGTRKIAEAVVKSRAFKVVGGGDTEAALTKFGLVAKIDYISSGGGAMFDFLAKGTLPGIEAVVKN